MTFKEKAKGTPSVLDRVPSLFLLIFSTLRSTGQLPQPFFLRFLKVIMQLTTLIMAIIIKKIVTTGILFRKRPKTMAPSIVNAVRPSIIKKLDFSFISLNHLIPPLIYIKSWNR